MGATKAKAPPSPTAVKVAPAPRAADNNDYGFQDSTITDYDYDYDDADTSNGDDRKRAAESIPKNNGTSSAVGSTETDRDGTTNKVAATKPTLGTSSPTIMSTPPRPKSASSGDTGDDHPKFRQARPADPSLTSSQSRVESFKSHGLSELSKQIRIAHAKNTAMESEIERLERQ